MPTTTNPATPASLHALSRHALARMQQRGIPAHALDCLFDYGRELHDHRGGVVLFFDKAARRRLERDTAPALRARIARIARTYAVMSRGEVVTVGHRWRRLSRN